MICPNCSVAARFSFAQRVVGGGSGIISESWWIDHAICPECEKPVIYVNHGVVIGDMYGEYSFEESDERTLVYPKGTSRKPLSPHVPTEYASDYKEACLVLGDSPKASAALSRRCLQHMLVNEGGVKKRDLADQIQEVLDRNEYPKILADSVDAIRVIGNFAAHPVKSKKTGEIMDVEVGEAEWNIEVLESLFDYYFVRPAELSLKKDALNKRLEEAGKPLMK